MIEEHGFVELDQQFPNHVDQVPDDLLAIEEILKDLLPKSLCPGCVTVLVGVAVHTAYHCSNGVFLPISCWQVYDICSQEDDRLLEY